MAFPLGVALRCSGLLLLAGFAEAMMISKDKVHTESERHRAVVAVGAATSIQLLRRREKRWMKQHHGQQFGFGTRVVHKTAYFGKLQLGTPHQDFSVVFDTGSGNLIIPGADCNSEACKTHARFEKTASSTVEKTSCDAMGQDEEVSITFGTGEIWGKCMRDQICIGGVCDTGSFISSTYESQIPFGQFGFDGVLGLSLSEMSQGPSFNLMNRLLTNQLLRSPVFTVFLSDDSTEASEITFGEIKQDHIASDVVWADISRASGYWEVQMEDITIDGKPQDLCVDCKVAVDTGTSELAGPSEIISKLQELLNVQSDCGNFDSLPRLGFVVNGTALHLQPDDYVDKEGGWCEVALMPLDVPPPNGPLFVFGIPFLQRFFTVYNASSRQVGFAVARHRNEDATAPNRRFTRVALAGRERP